MAAPLLAFHKDILEEIHDPSTSDLLILARGLGLRRIICTLMKIYDSPQNLVLLVNATPEEEVAIGEELGIMGCRKPGLRIVDYEMGKRDRSVLVSLIFRGCQVFKSVKTGSIQEGRPYFSNVSDISRRYVAVRHAHRTHYRYHCAACRKVGSHCWQAA